MSNILKISEAAVLGLHAMIIIAGAGNNTISTKEIAKTLNASENHLSKVMQRLVKAGYLKSVRGPGGGFTLSVNPETIMLSEIYELFDGALTINTCLFDKPLCLRKNCVFGDLLYSINSLIMDFFKGMTLKQSAEKITGRKL